MQMVRKLERRMRACRRGVTGRRPSGVREGAGAEEAWSGGESSSGGGGVVAEGGCGESSVSEMLCDIVDYCRCRGPFRIIEQELGFCICILISGQVTINVQPFIPVSALYPESPSYFTYIRIPFRRN
jgi:hypothetical protein